MSDHPSITADDIFNILKRSSLDTILVEGDEDILIVRRYKELYGLVDADIQQCHGCKNLYGVYEKRHLLNHIRIIFVSDKDKYLYTSVPDKYKDIIYTTGYSIENDLYHNSAINNLFTKKDFENLKLLINNFCIWYAHQVHTIKSGVNVELADSPYNVIFDKHPFNIQENYQIEEPFKIASSVTHAYITENYSLQIRGHSLMDLLQILFKNRNKKLPKYGISQLTEIALTMSKPPYLLHLMDKISTRMAT